MEDKEKTQEKEDDEELLVEPSPVTLGQVATQYALVFRTPDGDMDQENYLVWMGNKLVEIKEALAGA